MRRRSKQNAGVAMTSRSGSRSLDLMAIGGLSVLLLPLPLLAARHLGADLRWIAAYLLILGSLTWWAYARDKRCAREGLWRVSEARLHLLEFLGGWPGALWAQRILRHKNAKVRYQCVFFMIILGHELAAYDALHGWAYSRSVLNWMTRGGNG